MLKDDTVCIASLMTIVVEAEEEEIVEEIEEEEVGEEGRVELTIA